MYTRKRWFMLLFAVLLTPVLLGGCKAGGQTESGAGKKEKEESGFQKSYVPSEFVQADVESDTLQWFCSAYAIYTEYNRKDLGMIGGTSPENEEMHEFAIKNALDSGWGIQSHRSAVKTINKLLSGGHRKKYRELIADMKKEGLLGMSEEKMETAVYDTRDDNDEAWECIGAYHAYHEFGENGIDGWDYCRALQVLGDCYQADYISLEECLDESLIVAKKLQSTFANWEDICRSYLYGYYFWKHSEVDTEWRWEIYEQLNAMPDGPYTVPYDTKLEENWKGVKSVASGEKEGQKTEDGEESSSEDAGVFQPKKDQKGRYILTSPDKEKEVAVEMSDDYECNTEWSDEDTLVFDYKTEGNRKGISYESLSFYVAKSKDISEEDESFASLLKDDEKNWKKDSLYKKVQYMDTKKIKMGDYTVKYCCIGGLTNDEEESCDKLWHAWFRTSDGYTVSCLALEASYGMKDREVSKKKILDIMSRIYEK